MIITLYILLALSLVGGVLTKISPIPSVNVYLFDLISFIIVVMSIKPIALYVKNNLKLLIPIFVFILVSLLGMFLHTKNLLEFTSSVSYLGRLILYLLLTIPLLTMPKNKLERLKKWMVYSGFVFVGLGYIQYVCYPSLRNLYYLGWDEHLYRLFSTFLDPNFAGTFIVLVILLYASFYYSNPRKSMISKLISLGGFAFLLPALFLTYSRGSFLVFIVATTILLFLLNKKKNILFLVAAVMVGILTLPKNLSGEGVNLLRTVSVVARFQYSEQVLKIFLDNPLIGVGYNTLRFVSAQYGFVKGADVLNSHAAAGVPNSYLLVLVTTGIAGFLAVVYFLLRILREIYSKAREHERNYYAIVVFSSLGGILIGSLFENLLFYAPITIWLVLITGILFGTKTKKLNIE